MICYASISEMDFPGSSADKESTCNAGDPISIPGSGRSPGEGVGYPLQYSWASLVAQAVMNLPAVWETWVWSLSWEYLLERWTATHSCILTLKFHEPRCLADHSLWVAESQTWLSDFHSPFFPQWALVWANSTRCWVTGKPGVLQSMGSQSVRHDWVTEQQQQILKPH